MNSTSRQTTPKEPACIYIYIYIYRHSMYGIVTNLYHHSPRGLMTPVHVCHSLPVPWMVWTTEQCETPDWKLQFSYSDPMEIADRMRMRNPVSFCCLLLNPSVGPSPRAIIASKTLCLSSMAAICCHSAWAYVVHPRLGPHPLSLHRSQRIASHSMHCFRNATSRRMPFP